MLKDFKSLKMKISRRTLKYRIGAVIRLLDVEEAVEGICCRIRGVIKSLLCAFSAGKIEICR
jgi:hypothetical protein